jgi:cytochrome c oxidase subunit 4
MTLRAAIFTWVGLLLLLALTVASTFVPLGPGNSLVNLAVAVAKAALIGAVFMHLRQARTLVLLAVVTLLLWIAFMYGFTLNDYRTR